MWDLHALLLSYETTQWFGVLLSVNCLSFDLKVDNVSPKWVFIGHQLSLCRIISQDFGPLLQVILMIKHLTLTQQVCRLQSPLLLQVIVFDCLIVLALQGLIHLWSQMVRTWIGHLWDLLMASWVLGDRWLLHLLLVGLGALG